MLPSPTFYQNHLSKKTSQKMIFLLQYLFNLPLPIFKIFFYSNINFLFFILYFILQIFYFPSFEKLSTKPSSFVNPSQIFQISSYTKIFKTMKISFQKNRIMLPSPTFNQNHLSKKISQKMIFLLQYLFNLPLPIFKIFFYSNINLFIFYFELFGKCLPLKKSN
jgi:hypothetical protein